MPLLIIFAGILLLLLLIMKFRLNAFVALLLVALMVGLAMGAAPTDVLASIQRGVGGTLGYLALILGLGAMLGSLLANSGAAETITSRLIGIFGEKRLPWALMLTGFIVGIPMFYTVAFIMLIPIIFSVAQRTGLPLVYVGIPMITSLSVTHGFLPPHPAPTAITVMYGADISLVLLYGLILAVPTVILAGVVFGKTLRNFVTTPPAHLFKDPVEIGEHPGPSFGAAVGTALIPVLLMGMGAVATLFFKPEELTDSAGAVIGTSGGNPMLYQLFSFLGDPTIALLLSVLIGIYTLGVRQGRQLDAVMVNMAEGVKSIALILLIIAGGGAFKQVLVDSGASAYIVDLMTGVRINPLLLAWLVAAFLRVALGSATVAALTAAGIVLPLIATTDVSPELLVLATGAGSLTLSQVNDTGFWLFKEYFGLTIPQTLRTWTVMETIVSVVGLVGCLLLDVAV